MKIEESEKKVNPRQMTWVASVLAQQLDMQLPAPTILSELQVQFSPCPTQVNALVTHPAATLSYLQIYIPGIQFQLFLPYNAWFMH